MLTPRQWIGVALLVIGCQSAPGEVEDTGMDAGVQGKDAGTRSTGDKTLATARGGSRVQMLAWTAPDGTRGGYRFHDTKLDLDCTWTPVDSGKYRCLPSDNAFYYPVRFADAACSRPVYTFTNSTCGKPPAYLRNQTVIATCPTSFTLRKRGEKLTERVYYFHNDDGTCTTKPAALQATEDLYAFGDPVPLTDFVAGTLHVGATINDFAQRTIEGEDGSLALDGLRDVAGGFDCTSATAADGTLRCLPVTVGTMGDAFTDAQCTMPAAVAAKSSCAPAKSFVSKTNSTGCGATRSIFPAGERLADGYQRFSTCGHNVAAPYLDYWSGGDEIPASTFVALPYKAASGQGRLQPMVLTTPAGTLAGSALWDTKLGRPCSPTLVSDGTYRCIGGPTQGFGSIFTPGSSGAPDVNGHAFADAECTQQLVLSSRDQESAGCDFAYAVDRDSAECPVKFHVFSIDTKLFEGQVFVKTPTECLATGTPGQFPARLLGPELDAGEFVELKLEPR